MKKRIVQILLGLVALAVVALILTFIFLGTIVKSGVEKVGPMVTKTPVQLDSANISVFGGSGRLKGFVLGNPEGFRSSNAISVGSVELAVAPASLLGEKKHIRVIKIEGPEITYEAGLSGSNLGKLLENVNGSAEQDKKAPSKEQQTTKTKLQVDELVVTGGKVHVVASVLGGTTVPLPEIRLTELGQGADGITPAELADKVLTAVVNATTKAVAANAGKIEDAGKALGTSATDQLKKAGSGVSDLFKKK
jgi:uncharacterized protein involved in outer membrane biogenesis